MPIPPGATKVSIEAPTPEEIHAFTEKAREISPKLHDLLTGLPYQVQGAILADLLATYVSGFYPESVRDDVLTAHILGVIGMMEGKDAAAALARDALGEKSRVVARPKSREETPPRGPTRGAKRH
jgi:hypothetical protein